MRLDFIDTNSLPLFDLLSFLFLLCLFRLLVHNDVTFSESICFFDRHSEFSVYRVFSAMFLSFYLFLLMLAQFHLLFFKQTNRNVNVEIKRFRGCVFFSRSYTRSRQSIHSLSRCWHCKERTYNNNFVMSCYIYLCCLFAMTIQMLCVAWSGEFLAL